MPRRLGKIAAVEWISEFTDGQKENQNQDKQYSRSQHHGTHPLDGKDARSVPLAEPDRQALSEALAQFTPQQARGGS